MGMIPRPNSDVFPVVPAWSVVPGDVIEVDGFPVTVIRTERSVVWPESGGPVDTYSLIYAAGQRSGVLRRLLNEPVRRLSQAGAAIRQTSAESGTCQKCGEPAPAGNDLCAGCESAEGAAALSVLRSAVREHRTPGRWTTSNSGPDGRDPR